jgi:hypothetical protein
MTTRQKIFSLSYNLKDVSKAAAVENKSKEKSSEREEERAGEFKQEQRRRVCM